MFTVEELGQEIAELAVHLDAATHRLLECIRQFDAECGWEPQGAVSCAHWLSWRIGLDPATAREKVRVARALGNLPAIDAALKSGKLSYAKVRALTRVATPEAEAKLIEVAMYSTGAQLERLCRGYRTAMTADNALPPPERSVRRRDLPGSMVKLEIVLLPLPRKHRQRNPIGRRVLTASSPWPRVTWLAMLAAVTAANASRSCFTSIRIPCRQTVFWPAPWTMEHLFPRKRSGAWPAIAAL